MNAPAVTTRARLVTIVAASELWTRLEGDLSQLGVTGYTLSRVSGHGVHGHRPSGLLDQGNVRVETVVDDEVAQTILRHLAATYPSFGLIAYAHDVEALVREPS